MFLSEIWNMIYYNGGTSDINVSYYISLHNFLSKIEIFDDLQTALNVSLYKTHNNFFCYKWEYVLHGITISENYVGNLVLTRLFVYIEFILLFSQN